jgi:hypothetical protein
VCPKVCVHVHAVTLTGHARARVRLRPRWGEIPCLCALCIVSPRPRTAEISRTSVMSSAALRDSSPLRARCRRRLTLLESRRNHTSRGSWPDPPVRRDFSEAGARRVSRDEHERATEAGGRLIPSPISETTRVSGISRAPRPRTVISPRVVRPRATQQA